MAEKDKKNLPKKSSAVSKIMATHKIGEQANDTTVNVSVKPKKTSVKKVLYLEIDDEITTIYDRLKHLKVKNIYIVVPKRALIFQSIVNLKILKRTAEELEKNIFIITNDPNGIHLSKKIGLIVYDKLEGHEHPSLVSGKFLEDQDITPLKASINTLDDELPTKRTEKKLSIGELVQRHKEKFPFFTRRPPAPKSKSSAEKKKEDKGKLVLVAPNRQALISLIIVSMIILLAIVYIALPGATITLTPEAKILPATVNVTLADIELNRAELDTNPFHIIPSYTTTKTIKKVLTYQATGAEFKGKNANGIVTVYNTSDHNWTLVEKTRFQTNDGLVFRSQRQVSVPAARNGQPGTLDVAVIADEKDVYKKIAGDRGNIPAATKFFLPALSEENQKLLYAENKQPFTGGVTDFTRLISKEDLEAAKAKMIQALQDSAQAELEASVRERNESQKTNLVLLTGYNALRTSEPKVTLPPNLENQKLDSFEVQGEMTAVGTAYSKDDLMGILKTELKLKKSPEKRLAYIDENSLTYRIMETDESTKRIKITATIKGLEEYEVSPDKENGRRLIEKIKEHVLNKDRKEAELYIQNLPEIDKVHIQIWPAWAPTLPGLVDNIKIEVKRSEV